VVFPTLGVPVMRITRLVNFGFCPFLVGYVWLWDKFKGLLSGERLAWRDLPPRFLQRILFGFK
jgi:hypothetical protein